MASHIGFNVLLYLIGYFILTLNFPIHFHLRHLMSFLAGMLIWAISSLILVIINIPLTLASILLFVVFELVGIALLKRTYLSIFNKERLRMEAKWLSVHIIFFIAICLTAYNYNITYIVHDSFEYIGIGRGIALSGQFPIPGIPYADIIHFLQARMAFLVMLVAGGTFFGIYFPFILFPVTSIYLALLVGQLTFMLLRDQDISKRTSTALGAIAVAILISIPGYAFNAWFINQNLFVSAYFSISIIGVLMFRLRSEHYWLVIAGLALSTTIITRVELTFFSVLPLILLLGSDNINRKSYLIFLKAFLPLAFAWYIFKTSLTGMGKDIHDWPFIHFIVLGTYTASYFLVCWNKIHQRVLPKIVWASAICALAALAASYSLYTDGTATSLQRLFQIAILSDGIEHLYEWGGIWIATAAGILLQMMLLRNNTLDHLALIILTFFIMRILLYSVGLFPEGTLSDYNSGSRILLHIAPIAVVYLVLTLGYSIKAYLQEQSAQSMLK